MIGSHARVVAAFLLALMVAVPAIVAVGLPGTPAEPSPSATPTAFVSPSAVDEPPSPGAAASPSPATSPSPAATPRPPATPSSGDTGTEIVPGTVDRTSLDLDATYDVELELDFAGGRLEAESTMLVRNTSGGPVDRLELNTVAARLGGLELLGASIDGRAAEVAIDDQTLLVPLGGTLPDGASATVVIGFTATLRSDLRGSSWLFTKANGIANLYRWLPWISRSVPFERPNHGDPFVTPVSPEVRVAITTDQPLTIAATGEQVSVEGLTSTFVARNVRDFAITASPAYETIAGEAGGTAVIVYHRAGAPARAMLTAAREALQRLEALVGPYPYETFRVAQSAGGYGMEAPGLIWIPTGVRSANLRYLVFHETAHQWFYGVVGGDQADEPFTDEATADFIARHALSARRASRCAEAPLDRPIYRYSSACYYEVVYIQGGNLLDDVRRRMGADAFWTALRAWIDDHRLAIASGRSLLDTLDAHTTIDLEPLFRSRFPDWY